MFISSSRQAFFRFLNASALVAACLLALLPAAAKAQQSIWTQDWDHQGQIGPSSQTTDPSDEEVADDFDVVGTIDAVQADGSHIVWAQSPPMDLQSAYVRFYEWQNGAPGALQYERLIPSSAIATSTDETGRFLMQIPLPEQFSANGKHFVSVQTVSNLGWYWRTSNTNHLTLSPAKTRNRAASGGWITPGQTDVVFTLFGSSTGGPQLQSIAETTAPRSGRIRLFGSSFGTSPGTSHVRIGGVNAIVTSWTNLEIHAYVPESLAPGSHQVEVVTSNGSSTGLPLTVTDRTSPGVHAAWRFQADALGVSTAPVVGPDGTIYVMDDLGNLYALTPDGGLLWATKSGFQGSRLTRGFDGTLYTMADGILRATNPDGTHKWDFSPPGMNWTISGPTVGPDGNIYGTTQYGPLGFFSVTPEGQLRWANPQVGDRIPRGHAIVFSEGQAYINHRNDEPLFELMAFGMEDGALRWMNRADRTSQPLIGPEGRIYVDFSLGALYSRIYNTDGSIFSSQQSGFGMRSFSPDFSKIYTNFPSATHISAVNHSTNNLLWSFNTGILLIGAPTPDPLDRYILARTHEFGSPGNLVVLTSAGEFVWRENLPAENGGTIILTGGPVFSPDGNVAYLGSMIPGQDVHNEYCYVYAFPLDPGTAGPAPSSVVSRKIHGAAGAFDIPLALTGPAAIESRGGGPNGEYQIVVSFPGSISTKDVFVSEGSAHLDSYSAKGSQAIINLTGVTSGQRVMITLDEVTQGPTTSGAVHVPLRVIVGDTSANGTVNAADVSLTKSQAGGTVSRTNFRSDVNASGTITASDVSQVKANVGQTLP